MFQGNICRFFRFQVNAGAGHNKKDSGVGGVSPRLCFTMKLHLKFCGFCYKKEAVSFLEITACCYYDESVLKRKRAQKDVFKEFVHVHPPTMQQP